MPAHLSLCQLQKTCPPLLPVILHGLLLLFLLLLLLLILHILVLQLLLLLQVMPVLCKAV